MKRLLRSILDFLERKFPDRIEVKLSEYQALHDRLDKVETFLEKIDIDRLAQIESEINKFNMSLGFGSGLQRTPSTQNAFKR